MSLINQALKKAQKRTSLPNRSGTHSPEASALGTTPPTLHSPSRNKGRWYLVVILLIPALTLPILSSRWNQEKRHYREEIEVLIHTPTPPVAKHDFRSSPKQTALAHNKAENGPKEPVPAIDPARGSRYIPHNHENPAVSKFINQSRISSIRAAGKNSKIVINNRTIPIDNYVDDDLPIRLKNVSKD